MCLAPLCRTLGAVAHTCRGLPSQSVVCAVDVSRVQVPRAVHRRFGGECRAPCVPRHHVSGCGAPPPHTHTPSSFRCFPRVADPPPAVPCPRSYGTNYIVGGVTVSQLRVQLKDCRNSDALHGMRVANDDTKVVCRVDGLASEEPFSEDIEDRSTFGDNGVEFTWAGNNEAQGYGHWSVDEERSKTWNRLTDWQTAYPSGECCRPCDTTCRDAHRPRL